MCAPIDTLYATADSHVFIPILSSSLDCFAPIYERLEIVESYMAGKVMHAVQYNSYGSGAAGLKHVEVHVPTPKKDEVLLKLEATRIIPIDWKIQKGMLRPLLPTKFPFISTIDVRGEVVEVGSNVKSFKADEKVVAMLNVFEVLVEAWILRRKTEQIGLKRTRNGIYRLPSLTLRVTKMTQTAIHSSTRSLEGSGSKGEERSSQRVGESPISSAKQYCTT
uniref:Quinone-oxidoreductase homolog, chloroplastic n=1 Tax=Solanum tuberosum TaxID=4113 RepID=M1DL22_SOLTU